MPTKPIRNPLRDTAHSQTVMRHAKKTERKVKRRNKIIVLGLLLIVAGGLGLWKLNKDFLLLWNSNSINVTTDAPLTQDKVKIEFGISINTINRATDTELFQRREKYTVLYDGKIKDEMINDYGENDFLITYNNKYYFSFRQFKFNGRHQHDYNFHFSQKDNKVFIRANIKGQDAMKFERPMLDISLADKYRCNVPVDSAGVIYNMIELVNPNKKWLEFHKIKDSDFEKYGNDVERKMKWIEYDLTEDYKEIFRPFRLYSSDSTYFLDLDSYSLVLEKKNGRLISYGSEIDRKVQVIRNSDNQAATLLFCGTNCYPETANWISDKTLQILGFSLDDNNNFIPTKWTVDLNNMLFSQYRTDKKIKKMPPSYMEQERLKIIEFKE